MIAIAFLCYFTITSANRLDPQIFESLTNSELPPISNTMALAFVFNTERNTLLSLTSQNATYRLFKSIEDPQNGMASSITLSIPLGETNMTGRFTAKVKRLFPEVNSRREASENRRNSVLSRNHGSYIMTLRNVHLTFNILVFRQGRSSFSFLQECVADVERMRMGVVLENEGEELLGSRFINEMIRAAAKEKFSDMFCTAMRDVLSRREGAIYRAILSRIQAVPLTKSSNVFTP